MNILNRQLKKDQALLELYEKRAVSSPDFLVKQKIVQLRMDTIQAELKGE